MHKLYSHTLCLPAVTVEGMGEVTMSDTESGSAEVAALRFDQEGAISKTSASLPEDFAASLHRVPTSTLKGKTTYQIDILCQIYTFYLHVYILYHF